MANIFDTTVSTLAAAIELPKRPTETVRHFSQMTGNWPTLIAVFALLSVIAVVADPEPIVGSLANDVENFTYLTAKMPLALVELCLISALLLAISAAIALTLGSQKPFLEFFYSRLPIEGFVTVWSAALAVIDRMIGPNAADSTLVAMVLLSAALLLLSIYGTFLSYRFGALLPLQQSVAAAICEFALIATVLWLLMHKGAAS